MADSNIDSNIEENLLSKSINCSICDKNCKTNSKRIVHEKRCSVEKPYQCNVCQQSFKYLSRKIQHEKWHEFPGGFLCTICKQPFTSDVERTLHREKEHKIHRCEICTKRFFSEELHQEHVKECMNTNTIRYFICTECGAQYKTQVQLKQHNDSKCGTIRIYQCTECPSQFMTMSTLNAHRLIHKGEKKHLCNYCGSSFLSKGQLNVHERCHTGEKPFKCEICNKSFSYRESLVTHSSLHSGIKPYMCEGCGHRFSCIGNLIKHRRSRPNSCGLPQYKNTKMIAPRPSSIQNRNVTVKNEALSNCDETVLNEPINKNDGIIKVIVSEMPTNDDIKMNKSKLKQKIKSNQKRKRLEKAKITDSTKFEQSTIELQGKEFVLVEIQNGNDQDTEMCDVIEPDLNEPITLSIYTTNFEPDHDQSISTNEIIISDQYNDNNDDVDDEKNIKIESNGITYHIEEKQAEDIDEFTSEEFKITFIETITEDEQYNDDEPWQNVEQPALFENSANFLLKTKENVNTFKEPQLIISAVTSNFTDDTVINAMPNEMDNNTEIIIDQSENELANESNELSTITKENKIDNSMKAANETIELNKTETTDDHQSGSAKEIFIDDITEAKYRCDKCPMQYIMYGAYQKHMQMAHNVEMKRRPRRLPTRLSKKELLECKICQKTYVSQAVLRKHEAKHGPSGTLVHKCSCCTTYFESMDETTKHQRLCHMDKLKCTMCNKIFKDPDILSSHVRYSHIKETIVAPQKKNLFVCPRCGKKFTVKLALSDHERSLCGEKPIYKCNVCKKCYHSAGSLKTHQTVHTGDLPHRCGFCGKSFRTHGQVKVHERKHNGIKPFKCEFCDKSFAYRESLMTHHSTHTGIKRFMCQTCGARFSCISNLLAHRRSHKSTCGKGLPIKTKAVGPMDLEVA